jgi:CBS domain-containing protein
MASRADWRNDLDGWARTVGGWADPADSTRLVGVDIGFDVRAVEGVGDLAAGDVAERFARMVADATRSELTAARLARAAVASRPPSPVWGRVGRNPLGPLGSRHRRFDIKRHGVQPIVDLARVYTLVRGGTEVGTAQRLAAAAAEGQLGPDLAATLVEGLRLLTWTRLSAQLGDVDGADGDHHVDWTALPGPLRTQFSDTFGAMRTAQDALRGRYHLPPGA